ncbi:Xylose isomerase-like TIM barrel [Fuerstiella marisgermanici]|uniref:Xylose isomerase-like TIM barrel n=1 Tax=Fuerstiella marisgermanici TaxID=1891926 RepID=A0A1P8WSB7_9PLAN|nr:sugar phosphate isomerase/epimerase family protein [Fuerstiella marisgermanici]APZ96939.1 Xylose isomerase-like TIM barrel [Fuerstiella marisgermanici]
MPTRRTFLAASAAAAFASSKLAADESSAAKANQICVFTKPFNSLTFDELATQTANIGFNGIEAPIRPGGHIEPEAVPDKLPQLVAALEKQNQKLTVLTSNINDPSDPLSEAVLRTAAKLGIRYYRMQYFKYDESKSITKQIDEWRMKMKDLAALNKQLGITAVYQNHAGRNYFGAPIWDLHRGLDGIDPTQVGVAYDIRHATVEAGMSWPIGFHLIRPHIQVVYVKDFTWGEARPTNVPLGDGRVDSKFFRMLARTDFRGPVSLHEEYIDHRKPELVPEHWEAIRKDLKTLKSWL